MTIQTADNTYVKVITFTYYLEGKYCHVKPWDKQNNIL